jgi:hypothetical protein
MLVAANRLELLTYGTDTAKPMKNFARGLANRSCFKPPHHALNANQPTG